MPKGYKVITQPIGEPAAKKRAFERLAKLPGSELLRHSGRPRGATCVEREVLVPERLP